MERNLTLKNIKMNAEMVVIKDVVTLSGKFNK